MAALSRTFDKAASQVGSSTRTPHLGTLARAGGQALPLIDKSGGGVTRICCPLARWAYDSYFHGWTFSQAVAGLRLARSHPLPHCSPYALRLHRVYCARRLFGQRGTVLFALFGQSKRSRSRHLRLCRRLVPLQPSSGKRATRGKSPRARHPLLPPRTRPSPRRLQYLRRLQRGQVISTDRCELRMQRGHSTTIAHFCIQSLRAKAISSSALSSQVFFAQQPPSTSFFHSFRLHSHADATVFAREWGAIQVGKLKMEARIRRSSSVPRANCIFLAQRCRLAR